MVQLHEFPAPTEGIRFQNPSIVAVIDDANLGMGTLYVAESSLCWRSASSGEGFELEYPKMCLHAISRDVNLHPRDCIYIMVNGKFCADDRTSEEDDDEDPEYDPEDKSTEMKLVPDDPELLPAIYAALQDCSLLHPDPSSDMSLDEEDEDEFGGSGDHEEGYDSDEDGGAPPPGLDGAGDHGNGYHPHPNQFADADGDEEESI